MLMEELFARGIMTIGPSRADPVRQVGVFNPAFVATLPALRASEMEKFRWLAGEWTHENRVPATRLSPAHTDIGSSRFGFSESDGWIYALAPNGDRTPQIMTMVGITRNWRMTWTRQDDDEFRFVNEEQAEDGAWVYIDDYPHDWRDLPEATENSPDRSLTRAAQNAHIAYTATYRAATGRERRPRAFSAVCATLRAGCLPAQLAPSHNLLSYIE